MKQTKLIFSLLFSMVLCAPVFAQNGNSVVSEVKVYDMGNGTGTIEVRISGNQAEQISALSFIVSGDRIPGGAISSILSGSRPVNQPGNPAVILTGGFPLLPGGGNQPDFVDLHIAGYEFGNRKLINGVAWGVVN